MAAITLSVKNFAQIKDAKVAFGDLTVLVGPQATGKSLMLQLLKFGLDRTVVSRRLRKEGFAWPPERHGLLATYLGEGYENCFRGETEIKLGARNLLQQKGRSNAREPKVFFVPAQRVVTFTKGWPRAFSDYDPGDPFVVREFSQQLFEFFGRGLGREGRPIFPNDDRLKAPIRKSIESSIFHGGNLRLKRDGPRKQLVIQYPGQPVGRSSYKDAEIALPFLEWSAGQREFTPLLLGLYQLIPAGKVTKHSTFNWAIIEEPEMGLHPKAINSVMLLAFELIHRGYKVAISTHAPYLLDLVWAIQELKRSKNPKRQSLLLQALGNEHAALRPMANSLLKKDIRVYALSFSDEGSHFSTDISSLDPSSNSEIVAGWGGITSLSRSVSKAVARGTSRARSNVSKRSR